MADIIAKIIILLFFAVINNQSTGAIPCEYDSMIENTNSRLLEISNVYNVSKQKCD